MEFLFWFLLFVIFYAFIGYGIVLFVLVKLKSIFSPNQIFQSNSLPGVAFVVPCYNEGLFIIDKIKNTLKLDYPNHLLKIYFITDGSTDNSNELIKQFPEINLLFQPQRAGKTAAENRAMSIVDSEIVVFCDANTQLPPEAIKELVKHYANPKVGAVSGEKRIMNDTDSGAAQAGEGIYWKYESFLKKYDSELLTIVGAAGELFSFRKALFSPLPTDTILDDFMLSMKIAAKGYRVIYEPKAYAVETASANVKEEMKRKIRICAGGWQSIVRLIPLINPLKHPVLTFEYFSHRVLRWTIAPVFLFLLLPINFSLIQDGSWLYSLALIGQIVFYVCALVGWYFQSKAIKIKAFFVPYYFLIMNLAVVLGFVRYVSGGQSAVWEKAKRA